MNIIISLGNSNYIAYQEIVAIFMANSKPIKRLVSEARENNKIIDFRSGSKTKSVILTMNGSIVLSSFNSKTLVKNINETLHTSNLEYNIYLMPLIHIGNNNYIPCEKIYYLESTLTASGIKSMRNKKKNVVYYDISQKTKTRAIINIINGEMILTNISSNMISKRYNEAMIAVANKKPYYISSSAKKKGDENE